MSNHGHSAGSDPSPLIEKFKKLVDPNSEIHARSANSENKEKKKI
jgi:hypothetical protein